MKIRTGSNSTLIAVAAAVPGILAMEAWATTIAPAKTNQAGTGVNDPGYNRRQAPAIRLIGTPQYQIFDIGVVQVGDSASQGFGVSRAGIAVGRSFQASG